MLIKKGIRSTSHGSQTRYARNKIFRFAAIVLTTACFLLVSTGDFLTNDFLARLLLQNELNFFRSSKVPKVLHFMVLGEDPPQYMLEMVRFNRELVEEQDPEFTTKLWRDEDVEKLVHYQDDPALSQAWEYVKADERPSRYAKMADFIRPLILYVEGGVYLDADMIACDGIDFLLDAPGLVSFPFLLKTHNEVNAAGASAPKRHRLMKMAMESFIAKGPELATLHNLEAAGPRAMGKVTDEYISGLGFGQIFPHFNNETENQYELPEFPEVVDTEQEYWTRLADIRYAPDGAPKHIYHMEFGSWKRSTWANGVAEARVCVNEPQKVMPFLHWFCEPKHRSARLKFNACGVLDVE